VLELIKQTQVKVEKEEKPANTQSSQLRIGENIQGRSLLKLYEMKADQKFQKEGSHIIAEELQASDENEIGEEEEHEQDVQHHGREDERQQDRGEEEEEMPRVSDERME